ncbi:MAG TPA: hypothetical protein DCP97_00255 [Ruminococcaceae bacterium]|nr:hypothetical protein [Oscillospiraceae bacterium]
MNIFSSLKKDVIALLASKIENAAITDEFMPQKKQVPLKGCIVAVRMQSVDCDSTAIDTYIGDSPYGEQLYGRLASITLCFDICTGIGAPAGECSRVFDSLVQTLFSSSYKISRLWCDELKFDRQADGFLLKAYASISCYLALNGSETSPPLNNVKLNTTACFAS